jgi:hypothetical protein
LEPEPPPRTSKCVATPTRAVATVPTCGLWSQVGARQGVQRWKVQFKQASSPEGTSADCQYALWSTRQPGEGDRTTRDAAPPAPGPRQWVVTLACGLDFFFSFNSKTDWFGWVWVSSTRWPYATPAFLTVSRSGNLFFPQSFLKSYFEDNPHRSHFLRLKFSVHVKPRGVAKSLCAAAKQKHVMLM